MLLALAFIAVLSGCGEGEQAKGQVLARYQVVRSGLDITVKESGALKSARPANIMSRVQGKILFVVKEGEAVKQGDRLMELENRELASQHEAAGIDLDGAKRARENAERDLKLQELEAQKQTGDASRTLRFAKMALAQYVEGKAPLQEKDLSIAVERAETEDADAREKSARMPALLEKGFVTPAEQRTTTLEAREKAAALAKKTRELEIFLQFEKPQEMAKLDADVRGAELGVERTIQTLATQRAQKEAEIAKQGGAVDRAQTKLDNLAEQLAQLVITAPGDGIVVYGGGQNRWGGQDATLEVGKDVSRNNVIMQLPDLTDMVAEIGVNEINVSKLRTGMRALTTVEGIGHRVFVGEVTRIATTASQEWNKDTKEYATTISLGDTTGAAFRPGMSAKVEILVQRIDQVLHVPVDAVRTRAGASWCWVETAGGALERREVKLGAGNDDQVVVESGLREGETVVVLSIEPDAKGGGPGDPVPPAVADPPTGAGSTAAATKDG